MYDYLLFFLFCFGFFCVGGMPGLLFKTQLHTFSTVQRSIAHIYDTDSDYWMDELKGPFTNINPPICLLKLILHVAEFPLMHLVSRLHKCQSKPSLGYNMELKHPILLLVLVKVKYLKQYLLFTSKFSFTASDFNTNFTVNSTKNTRMTFY